MAERRRPLDLLPAGYERGLPPGAQRAVRTHRNRLAVRAQGAVLDLGDDGIHQRMWARVPTVDSVVHPPRRDRLGWLMAQADAGVRFDTVFSVLELAAADPLDPLLDAVAALLPEHGVLLFVEPARLQRSMGRAQRLISAPVHVTTGWRTDRDIPALARAHGLTVTDIDRPKVRTVQWWISSLVVGVARVARPAATPDT